VKERQEDRAGEDPCQNNVNMRKEPMAQFEWVDRLVGWFGASENLQQSRGSGG
jgi:hypothetical protein